MDGKYGMHGELRNSLDVPEGKRKLVSPWCSWEYNFKLEPSSQKFAAYTHLA
jgi:hypothetical protein